MSYRNPFLSREARAVLAAYPAVPAERRRLISDCIAALKDTAFWSKADLLYVLAAPDQASAIINWKSPGTFNLAASGGLTFTADRQAKGNGTSGILEATGYNPSAGGTLLQLNDAMIGCYTREAASYDAATSRIDVYTGTGRLQRRSDATGYYSARINDGTSLQPVSASLTGHFMAQRTAADAKALYKDGASIATATTASTTIASEFTLFGTGTTNWSDAGLALAYAGAAIPSAEIEQVNEIFATYLRAIGAVN